ncbi:MAG: hypothetical protein Q8S33_15200 [Myxococcales bacterium]|nr:hypothetical protein [Myxococcales bacterium]
MEEFFSETVTSFVKQAFDRQIKTVRGWLSLPNDAALEAHRTALTKWSDAAADAQVKTSTVGALRGQSRQQRETLADALTRERDGLSEALSQRARDRKLPRDWPTLFFPVTSRNVAEPEAPTPPAQPA